MSAVKIWEDTVACGGGEASVVTVKGTDRSLLAQQDNLTINSNATVVYMNNIYNLQR